MWGFDARRGMGREIQDQKVESIVVLMAGGGDCYDDMAVLRSDEGLQRLLGYSLPSPDSVRAFVNAFHNEQLIEQAKAGRGPNAMGAAPFQRACVVKRREPASLVPKAALKRRGSFARNVGR